MNGRSMTNCERRRETVFHKVLHRYFSVVINEKLKISSQLLRDDQTRYFKNIYKMLCAQSHLLGNPSLIWSLHCSGFELMTCNRGVDNLYFSY